MNRKDRRAAEKTGRHPSAGSPADAMFAVALGHHTSGRLDDAQRLYEDALSREPHHAGALIHLGMLHHQLGRAEAALAPLKKASATDKSNPLAHFGLGLAYAALGRDDEAIAANSRALKLRPDYADAHTNLGALLLRRGQAAEARGHFAKALHHNPGAPASYENYAVALLATGEDALALEIAAQGLAISATSELRALFLRALPHLASMAVVNREAYRPILRRALDEAWYRPTALAPAVKLLVSDDPDGWPQDELWLSLLRSTPNTDAELEHRLAALRRRALNAAVGGHEVADLAFVCTLAQQCFLNEYVFDVSETEREQADTLGQRVRDALASAGEIDAAVLATLACYSPLSELSHPERLAGRSWPDVLLPVIVQQIEEPARERQLRSTIEVLSTVSDSVSLKVQRQYEENPYPRWTHTLRAAATKSLDVYVQDRFPGCGYHGLGNKDVEILIAGCGTGRQIVEAFGRYRIARATALDLSQSSLAYAARKVAEAGHRNVRLAQADILELGTTLGPFDVIEATGVLHHLHDPLEGWRRLVALLRPGGLMLVALYSAVARSHVRAARAFVAEQGFPITLDGIRSAREKLRARPSTHPAYAAVDAADFFTTSECRDYLFHVQEAEFDLPQIGRFLAENALTFIGFETTSRDAYLRRFADDPTGTDLNKWNVFEAENPSAFAAMYQFWIQKPP